MTKKFPGLADLDLTDEELLSLLPDPPAHPLSTDPIRPLPELPQTPAPRREFPQNLSLSAFDPATLGFPPMLAMELALNTAPVDQIFEGYGLTVEDYERLCSDPVFVAAVADARERVKEEGMSFKIKAKLQAEELLKQSWKLIHDHDTPHNVRADLIKSTVRWAGHEPKGGEVTGFGGTALQINIHMGNKE